MMRVRAPKGGWTRVGLDRKLGRKEIEWRWEIAIRFAILCSLWCAIPPAGSEDSGLARESTLRVAKNVSPHEEESTRREMDEHATDATEVYGQGMAGISSSHRRTGVGRWIQALGGVLTGLDPELVHGPHACSRVPCLPETVESSICAMLSLLLRERGRKRPPTPSFS